jgi:hypothetical protein
MSGFLEAEQWRRGEGRVVLQRSFRYPYGG